MALSSVQVMLLIQNICNNVLGIWCCRMKVIFLQLPLLLTRTLDLDLDNKGERLQGVKLARRYVQLFHKPWLPSYSFAVQLFHI